MGTVDPPRFRTLDEIIRALADWGGLKKIVGVVAQDEYSHDVVIAWSGDRYVVYGVT
jgi:hypothetical protein